MLYFARSFFTAIEKQRTPTVFFQRPVPSNFSYQPVSKPVSLDPGKLKIVLVTDDRSSNTNLGKMITQFTRAFTPAITIIGLDEIDIRGACLGCMKCGYVYSCQYRDGFVDFYNNQIRTADIFVIAGTIKVRFLSAKWKTFFDRAFFWNHTPSLAGKQIAYLISGPLWQNQNLGQVLESLVTVRQNANLVDIVTDETELSGTIDSQLEYLAERLLHNARFGYLKPQNFLAVGGHKIFRDNIWGRMRGIWQADHRHLKKTGYYDFPQNNWRAKGQSAVLMGLTRIPAFRKKLYANLKEFPAERYHKLIHSTPP